MRNIRELMNLNGRAALITGGGGHIGRAVCEALAELGADVALLDRGGAAEAAAAELAPVFDSRIESMSIDLLDDADVAAVAPKIRDMFGRLDIFVHCAAFVGASKLEGWVCDFEQQTTAVWRQALEVNLTSLFTLSRTCAPMLRQHGKGSIIAFSSIYGLVGPDLSLYQGTAMGNPAGYGASKGGVQQLVRYMSTVLAPEIRVNAISPGGVERGQPEGFKNRYEERTPMRRMGMEEDFKGAAVYLASDLSAYVTGHNLVVDGGWTAW